MLPNDIYIYIYYLERKLDWLDKVRKYVDLRSLGMSFKFSLE